MAQFLSIQMCRVLRARQCWPCLLWIMAGATCAGQTLPFPGPPEDPEQHQMLLVGFAKDDLSYLALERTVGPGSQLRLRLIEIDSDRQHTLRELDLPIPTGAAKPFSGSDLLDQIRRDTSGQALQQLGFLWPRSAAATTTLPTPFGEILLHGNRVLLTDGDFDVTIGNLSATVAPDQLRWHLSPSGALVGLSICYPGHPVVEQLTVFNVRHGAAQLLARKALKLHQDGNFRRARAYWLDALQLAPSDPDITYNLACAQARLGRPAAAIEYLARAIDLGGDKYRRWANVDSDFESLHGRREFRRLLRDEPSAL